MHYTTRAFQTYLMKSGLSLFVKGVDSCLAYIYLHFPPALNFLHVKRLLQIMNQSVCKKKDFIMDP